MASKENDSDASLKLAIAMVLLRLKLFPRSANSASSSSADGGGPASSAVPPVDAVALRWKRKAKERKQELLRLKEDLKEAQDSLQHDLLPQTTSCKCYFFESMGKSSTEQFGDNSSHRYRDVLPRQFLRQVRLKERRRRKADSSVHRWHHSEFSSEDETDQLKASVDFLVELCDTVSNVKEPNFANWSHQAVDFILASLKGLLPEQKNLEVIDAAIGSLIMRLLRRMCYPLEGKESQHTGAETHNYVQHLIRKLGSEPYVGLRVLLAVCQRISVLAESLLFLDPFDDAFPNMHASMYLLIQLSEFLVSDYLLAWSNNEYFDNMLFEEWVASVLHARKALELLESRHGLYVLYMDRVIAELAKLLRQVSSFQSLNQDILDNLLR